MWSEVQRMITMAWSCRKELSALLRGVTSKHYSDFYCLNCLHYFRTKNKLESHKKVCENKDFCNVIVPFEDTKLLEFNQYQKSDKAPFSIYLDRECIIEKIDGCKNNPENSSTTKVSEHIPSGFSMSKISSFRSTENKQDDCIEVKIAWKSLCESLREHAIKIVNFEKKKNEIINKRPARIKWKCKNLLYLWRKTCKYLKDKKYHRVEIIVIIPGNIEKLNIAYVI